ncbi:MAG: NADH-quinone oxidoreductase subunit NuoF [Chloroflexi bacterium]|nr:NADH-quinone oxidoreductase subunit NuoF [Chloroflexota bacterium]
MKHLILRDLDIPNINDISVYEKNGGYNALRIAIKMTPDEGFSTGTKWSFLPKNIFPRYLVVNADESEPGTFKDRQIMERNPHQFIEGIIISAYAIQANDAYIYLRGEFPSAAECLERAIADAHARGYLGENILDTDYRLLITIHRGAGAYICGEETALLESLEGKLGQPRVKPPFPASVGLYGKPTVINNVETLTNIPPIIAMGAEAYAKIGTPKSTGPKVFCLSGHVNRPGNYEAALGSLTFRDLIFDLGGGVRGGKKVKAILPAGASAPMLTDAALDVKLDYDSVAAAGSQLGSASVIVLDEDTCVVWAAKKMTQFFKHESCGKCTPCREGTYWLARILERIDDGAGQIADVDLIANVAEQMTGNTLCPLGDFAAAPALGSIKHFREEYERHVREKSCWMRNGK